MRLSVESYNASKRFGDEQGLSMIREAGFDCVDYSFYERHDADVVLGDGYREYAKGIRRHLDRIGLICNQAHAPYDFSYGMEMNEETKAYRDIARAIEAAGILGAAVIAVHSIQIDDPEVDAFAYNLSYYQSLAPYARAAGIRIGVENLFFTDVKRKTFRAKGCCGADPDELRRLVAALDPACFTICVDVGHASLTGYEPEEFLLALKGAPVTALHIHDGDYLGDRHMLPYTCKFSWSRIMEALREINYRGDLTFEIITFLHRVPKEMLPDALAYAERTGRYLISLFE